MLKEGSTANLGITCFARYKPFRPPLVRTVWTAKFNIERQSVNEKWKAHTAKLPCEPMRPRCRRGDRECQGSHKGGPREARQGNLWALIAHEKTRPLFTWDRQFFKPRQLISLGNHASPAARQAGSGTKGQKQCFGRLWR